LIKKQGTVAGFAGALGSVEYDGVENPVFVLRCFYKEINDLKMGGEIWLI